jgi:hypothetical protein
MASISLILSPQEAVRTLVMDYMEKINSEGFPKVSTITKLSQRGYE